jgi:hypothetical protein
MRTPVAKPILLPLLVAMPVAVAGALFGAPWATGAGAVVVLGLLAVHPLLTDAAVPRPTRLLLWGSLLLLALTVLVEVSGWASLPSMSTNELVALVRDPARQHRQFVRELAVTGCLLAACGCLGLAVARLPRERLVRFGRAVPAAGACTLLALTFLTALPSLGPLLGSFTNKAVAALVVLGGCAWGLRRAIGRYGSAAVAAAGTSVLAAATWVAADDAWRSRPEPFGDDGAFRQVGVSVAVVRGPHVEAAVAAAALLLGAALAVLACARLSRPAAGPDEPSPPGAAD